MIKSDIVQRFMQSMSMDQNKWRDGTGYDLSILKLATNDQQRQIEDMILSRGIQDWRDVQALAILDSPRARAALETSLERGDGALQTAIVMYATHIGTAHDRERAIASALSATETDKARSLALLVAEEFHPPLVIDSLFRGVLVHDGATSGEFAAILMFLYGKASSSFDWDHRPYFLRFQTENRETLFRDLCDKVGVDAAKYL